MSTAQQTQTAEERDRVVTEWDSKKGALAETPKNLQIMQQGLALYMQKYGDFVSVEILNAVVKANAHQLDWLATPAPKATPVKPKGDIFQRLADVGVLKSSHLSVAEKEEAGKRAQNTQKAIVDWAKMQVERATLISEHKQAEFVTITHPNGPGRGQIWWSRTNEARKSAIEKVKAKIDAFNSKVPDDLKISI